MSRVRLAICLPSAFCLLLSALAAEARADDSKKIQKAIDSGVNYLKSAELADTEKYLTKQPGSAIGKLALVGLTLLECGVSADDPVVKRAAEKIRQASAELTHTYSIALALMFMDRLGAPRDVELIQTLGVRLLGGQSSEGCWGYECPVIDSAEIRAITTLEERRRTLVAGKDTTPGGKRAQMRVSRELSHHLAQMAHRGSPIVNPLRSGDDHSNTQFAILGLWIARRHNVPVETALALAEAHFLRRQNPDGGWGYWWGATHMTRSTPAMTCAGLLGVAVAFGARHEATVRSAAPGETKRETKGNPAWNRTVNAAFQFLSSAVGTPVSDVTPFAPVPQYYFLWALERVAVAYDLKTIGNKDWYAWGSDVLLAAQAEDGSWTGEWGNAVDTSFALLFLRRANLARDLTASMKGRAKELGEATLTAVAPPMGEQPTNAHVAPKEIPLDDETAKLRDDLVKAPAGRRDEILERYKIAKGAVHTQALAAAIPQLEAASQAKARDALAERLMRMNATTLRERLRDKDIEMRVAAARACAGKEELAHVPDLIALLEDREPVAVRAARSALKHLSRGKDFGPADETSAAERGRAVDAWKKWWAEQRP